MEKFSIGPDVHQMKPARRKDTIRKKIEQSFLYSILLEMSNKSKIRYILHNSTGRIHYRKEYMMKLGRFQASTIFKARSRMLDFKANFKGKYKDDKCRFCRIKEETQDHVFFECQSSPITPEGSFTIDDLFRDHDTMKLRKIARTIDKIIDKLDEISLTL